MELLQEKAQGGTVRGFTKLGTSRSCNAAASSKKKKFNFGNIFVLQP